MKKKIVLAAVLSGIALLNPVAALTAEDPNAAEAKEIIKTFFANLKGELEAAIKAGGPVEAITVCKDRAPAIAKEMSAKTGWAVGRTSLKSRNAAANAPDAWEKQVLLKFEERKAGGEDVQNMAYSEVIKTDGGKQKYRFMKAIPTAELCLVCHGEAISPDVAAAIDKGYPGDKARGYKLGDIRGAFTLSKPL